MENNLILVGMLLGAALIGALASWLLQQQKIARLREDATRLSTTLEMERQSHTDKLAELQQAREQLANEFSALSSAALKQNNEAFLKLAEQNLKQFQTRASGELEKKEKAIEHLISPIREALDKTEKQIQGMEKERKEAWGSLHKHLESMAESQSRLQSETRNLVQALRRPEVRGQWGELTLKRLAELAGMVEHCDFYEQESVRTEGGHQRPDMIVRMPDGREIIVDVKTPLDAYLSAIEAASDEQRDLELQRHSRNVRNRVNELASKAYWSQFKNSPDFVVLFIPGDQFLSAALDVDHALLEDALAQQIILATPTSFVALLRAVAYGWRQEQLAMNAEHIKQVGEELYKRLVTFSGHLEKMGRALDSSLKHYNSAVGSFDSRILPRARKFTEMGITASKEISPAEQIETGVRTLASEAEKETD